MFLGHFAVGLGARRFLPQVSLATWFGSVQLADLAWPVMLLLGLERVRVAPGLTAFTPLDFTSYPITHSLVGMTAWAVGLGAAWVVARRARGLDARIGIALSIAAAVLSHWFLDALVHRPDVPILPHGPYVGLGLWHSVPATLALELAMFTVALVLYLQAPDTPRGLSFWLLILVLLASYFGAAFGPPPPDWQTVAYTALAMWLLIAWASVIDRRHTARRGRLS